MRSKSVLVGPPGKTPAEGQASCVACEEGKAGAHGLCDECKPGTLASRNASSSCITCPARPAGPQNKPHLVPCSAHS